MVKPKRHDDVKLRTESSPFNKDTHEVWLVRNPAKLPLHELEENLAELLDQESVNIRMNGRLYESTKYYGTAELFPLLMLPTARDKVGAVPVPLMGIVSVVPTLSFLPSCNPQGSHIGPPEVNGNICQRFKPFGALMKQQKKQSKKKV